MKKEEKLAIVFVVLLMLIFTVSGAVQIDNCNNGAIYIIDDTSNPTGITCSGLSQNDLVEWYITQNGQRMTFATCDGAVCKNQVSYVNTVRAQVNGTSTLTYVQNIRQNADGALVYCNSANCVIRVTAITTRASPSTTRSNSGPSTTSAPGTTTPRSSTKTTVNNSRDPSTNETSGTTTPRASTRTTESNSRGPSTNATSGTARSLNASGTTAGSSQPSPSAGALESMSVGKSHDLPIAAIIGGVIGSVVAAIIVVIVAVFLIKRRKNQPKSAPHQKRSPRDKNDFEEHANPIYGTEDPNSKGNEAEDDVEDVGYAAVGPTHQPHTTHTAVYQPVNPSSANGAGRRTASDQYGENLYNSVDVDDLQAAHRGRGLHNPYQTDPSHVIVAGASEEYAIVETSGTGQAQTADPSEDVYAVVNKNKSRQISQSISALKRKPQSQSAEEPDDDYNKLNFHPSTNLARDPGNPEQLYNHLT